MDDARDMIRVRTGQIVLVQDSKGLGTGVVVGPDGWILTNKHVAPSVGPYRVVLSNGLNVHGVGVHQCVHHDLAIMKIGTATDSWVDLEKDLADDYVVGEEVWAIGHPRGCRFSVTRGIISNPHREIDKDYYVQTDVSINPGNSGGPLVDRDGKLIGIVTLMYTHAQGLGFAVPAHTASDYVRQVRRLVRQGVVKIPEALLAQAASEEKAAEEVVRTALDVLTESGGAAIEEEKPEEGFTKILRKGAQVDVKVADDVLNVRGKICRLGPTERGNAKFLADVLALNGVKLGGAAFHLDGDDLYLGVVRPTTGLDTMQAFAAMDSVLHLVETWKPKVNELFFSAMVPGGGVPKTS